MNGTHEEGFAMETLVAELKETIGRRPEDVVVIVGAGVAIASLRGAPSERLASWAGLLRSGLQWAASLRRVAAEEAAAIEAMLASGDSSLWIAAAEAITEALGGQHGGEFAAWLRATAGRFHEEVQDRALGEAIRALCEAGVLLATVNYDGILEAATGLPAVTWRAPVKVERVLRGSDRGILHLHGYWEDPASVVFGASSYEQVRSDAHARAVLTAMRMQKTLVLVGHGAGLADPNWGSFLKWTEEVFAGSEYRNYRLVREAERAKVQASHPEGQRIVALPFGREHSELAPFLRSLAPARQAAAPAREAATQTVVILLNVHEKDYTGLGEEEVRAVLGEPEAIFVGLERRIDPKTMTPRGWREIARAVERVAAEARAVSGPRRYVVCGRAPLPVFAYLGRALERLTGDVVFLNAYERRWERIPIPAGEDEGPDHFTRVGPLTAGTDAAGRVVLAVQCWKGLGFSMAQVKAAAPSPDEAIVAGFAIQAPDRSRLEAPMTGAELRALNRHVEAAQAWIAENVPNRRGVVVALGGPAWVAFWLGHRMNRRAGFGRVDFHNFDNATMTYVPALSSPRHEMPWISEMPRILFLSSEPDNLTRTNAKGVAETIEGSLAAELGRLGEGAGCEVRWCFEVTPEALRESIDGFRPDVIHVHMHGSARGVLGCEDEARNTRELSHDLFVRALKSRRLEPALIVMSSCHSALMASALEEVAECVIAMRGEVKVATATRFAKYLYRQLAQGRSLDEAVRSAGVDVEFDGLPGHSVITATSAVEDELGQVVLFRRGEGAAGHTRGAGAR